MIKREFSLKMFVRRLYELFGLTIAFSVVVSLMALFGIGDSDGLWIEPMLAAVIYAIVNIFLLRECFFQSNTTLEYYVTNFFAYLVFAAVNLLLYPILGETIYTWLFAICKFASFSILEMSTFESALVFHGGMLLVTALSPIDMAWAHAEDD